MIIWYLGARIEEFIYDKLDRKLPSKVTNAELLGQHMLDAATDLGPQTPYGQLGGVGGGYWDCWGARPAAGAPAVVEGFPLNQFKSQSSFQKRSISIASSP